MIVGYRIQQLTEFAESGEFHHIWWGRAVIQAFFDNAYPACCRRIAQAAITAEVNDDMFSYLTLDPFAALGESDEEQRHG